MRELVDFLSRTYLIERVISLLIYCFVLFLAYRTIRQAREYSTIKRCLNWYIVFLVVAAFFFVPDDSKDLVRIFAYSDYWLTIPFSAVIKNEILVSSTPLGNLFIYLCRLSGIKQLLPALTAFIFYTNVFYIFKKTYLEFKVSSRALAITLAVFMATGSFLEVISDIKCFMAFSILLNVFFREYINKRKRLVYYLFYLISALIHLSIIPIILVKLVFDLFFDFSSLTKKLTNVIVLMIAAGMGIVFLNQYIADSWLKGLSYLGGGAYSYTWEYVIGALFWLLYLYFSFNYISKRCVLERNTICVSISKFSILFLLAELVLCFEYNIFHRYLMVNSIILIPVISDYITKKDCFGKNNLSRNILLYTLMILIIVCARGNLCGYKFFQIVWD